MTEIPNGWAVYYDGKLVFGASAENWRTIGPAIAAIMSEDRPQRTGLEGERTEAQREEQAYRELGLRKIKVRIDGLGPSKTLTYQTAQDVAMYQEVEVPRWPGMKPGAPLRGTVVALTSDREGPLTTIIGG